MAETALTHASGRLRARRRVLAVVQWLFVGLLMLQVYLAGVFLMWDGSRRSEHEGLGWILPYFPLLTLVLAFIARMPRAYWASFGVMFVALYVQPYLALLTPHSGFGWLRAVHPLNAFLVLVLAVHQARMASDD